MHDNYFPSTSCTPIHRYVINRSEKEKFSFSFCWFIDQTYATYTVCRICQRTERKTKFFFF